MVLKEMLLSVPFVLSSPAQGTCSDDPTMEVVCEGNPERDEPYVERHIPPFVRNEDFMTGPVLVENVYDEAFSGLVEIEEETEQEKEMKRLERDVAIKAAAVSTKSRASLRDLHLSGKRQSKPAGLRERGMTHEQMSGRTRVGGRSVGSKTHRQRGSRRGSA